VVALGKAGAGQGGVQVRQEASDAALRVFAVYTAVFRRIRDVYPPCTAVHTRR
jgi:hypothetical protein